MLAVGEESSRQEQRKGPEMGGCLAQLRSLEEAHVAGVRG